MKRILLVLVTLIPLLNISAIGNSTEISEKGLILIENLEGCKLSTYNCPGGHLTIGIGHQVLRKDPNLGRVLSLRKSNAIKWPYANLKLTKEQALQLLSYDAKKYSAALIPHIKASYTQPQLDAWVSLFFNTGIGYIYNNRARRPDSTIHFHNLNKSKYETADQFFSYCTAKNKFMPGLFKRRMVEATLYLESNSVKEAMGSIIKNCSNGYYRKKIKQTSDLGRYVKLAQDIVDRYSA